ncbi:hypothetical protein AB1286_30315 [Trinickia sp. NRRL B-1857]|uniref:hypothetical protein n=1 Tax=Trinickia sp. NRRL B-1857 TaxID=3162879 RepID=UPI003D2C8393
MLGFTFWKHAVKEESLATSKSLHTFDRRHARRKLQYEFALAGAVIAAIAITAGWPVAGLVVYLASVLPFLFSLA